MKTIWGLFASYGDGLAALEDFSRQGLAEEDLAAVVRASALRPQAEGAGGKGRGPRGSQSEQTAKRAEKPAAVPPRLPGGEALRLRGTPTLVASGWLATRLRETTTVANGPRKAPAPENPLSAALTGLGLPLSYATIYAERVRAGQTLVVARVGDQQERDAVNTMRRHRVANLAGLIAQEPNSTG